MKRIKHIALLGLCALLACTQNPQNTNTQAHEHEHSHEHHDCCEHSHGHSDGDSHEHSIDEIVLPAAKQKALGIEIDTAKLAPFQETIRVAGQIETCHPDMISVIAPSSGVVTLVKHATAGTFVKSGETLFYISSKNIAGGDQVVIARTEFERTEQQFKRAEGLIADSLISRAEYEAAKAEYLMAKERYFSLSNKQTEAGIAIKSPADAFALDDIILQGQYVQAGEVLLNLAKYNHFQLRADVPEHYYKSLPKIKSAHFQLPHSQQIYSTDEMNGRLLSYGKMTKHGSHLIPIFFELENRYSFPTGAFAEVFLHTESSSNYLSVPKCALSEEQGLFFVYIKLPNEDSFMRREVKIGESNGESVQILSGLKVGEFYAKSGVTHIKLASMQGQIPEHNHIH